MKQTLAIARALLHRPELVFLDEPTAGLDPTAARALRDDLSRLSADEGVTIFLTTHNLQEAERLCALVGVVRRGRLLAVAPPNQLGKVRGTRRVEITGSGLSDAILAMLGVLPGVRSVIPDGRCLTIDLHSGSDVSPVVKALVSAGFELESMRNNTGSLDEAFQFLMDEPS